MGAAIEGIGTNTVTIHGGASLRGATHRIGPDHIEVGSFIGLAAVTRSELRIERRRRRSTCARSLMGFERLGIECAIEGDDLIVPAEQRARSEPTSADTCRSSRTSRGRRFPPTSCRSPS